MLFVTTYCIYKSTSYIYLFNNCKEKCTFSTRPRVFKRPNISRNTRWNWNFSLPFKNLLLKLHVIQTSLYKLGRNSRYYVLNISYFIHFHFEHLRSTMYGYWSCSGLKNLHFWFDKETHFWFDKETHFWFDKETHFWFDKETHFWFDKETHFWFDKETSM